MWLPTPRAAVEKVAVEAASGLVPRSVAPSKNSTEPPGVPTPVRTDTVAVNVTDVPKSDGLELLATTVEVVPLLTVWITEPELGRKTASPL